MAEKQDDENNCGALDYFKSGIDGCMGTVTQAKLTAALRQGGRPAALKLAKELNLAEKAQIERNLRGET